MRDYTHGANDPGDPPADQVIHDINRHFHMVLDAEPPSFWPTKTAVFRASTLIHVQTLDVFPLYHKQ